MEVGDRMLRSRLALIVSLALSFGSLGFFAVSSLGGFNATVSNTSNSVSSATILLQEGQGATTCLSTAADSITTNSNNCTTISLFGSVANAVPGSTSETATTVTFKNIGTAGASTFTLTPGTCVQSDNSATTPYYVSDTAFCVKIDITIGDSTQCFYPVSTSPCAAPTSTDTLTTLTTNGALSLGALASGATDTVTITVELDSSATNADQGLTATQPLTWEIAQ